MSRYGHAWIGALVSVDALNIPIPPPRHYALSETTIFMLIFILLGSCFPDVDMVLNGFKRTSYNRRTMWSHRGWTHHVALPVVILLGSLLLPYPCSKMLTAFAFGAAVHILVDMFSPLGVPYGTTYSMRIGIPLYTTGSVSEVLFAFILTVVLIIPMFVSRASAGSIYDNKTFLQRVHGKQMEIIKMENNKKLLRRTIGSKVIIYQERNPINAEAHRAARRVYSTFKNQGMAEVNKNINIFLRQEHIDINALMPPEKHHQILPANSYIYIFMSSSVPVTTWRNYAFAIDKLRRQGQGNIGIIMRGFIGGARKVMPTINFIKRVIHNGSGKTDLSVPILIDPYLFRLYGIKRVPVFVYAKNVNLINPTLSAGNPVNLKNTVTAYKVVGDWSFSYVLRRLYQESGDVCILRLYNALNRSWFSETDNR